MPGPAGLRPAIVKSLTGSVVPPNLDDYARVRADFSWDAERRRLSGPTGDGLNIADECVHRHVRAGVGDRVALRFLARGGAVRDVTYEALAERSARFADLLATLGVEQGDRVFFLLGRVPDLYAGMLGTLAHRAVACPLFSVFGPEPIRQRLAIGDGRVLVTTVAQHRRKVGAIRDRLPALEHVLLVDAAPGAAPPGTRSLPELLERASDQYEIGPTGPDDMALLHFTSGTTGTPKGAIHVHDAVVAHSATGRLALDLHEDDVYWCTADPGWVTGTSYGIIAPLVQGVTSIVDEGEFDADRWYATIARERVNVWYTAPTAVRMLMRVGADVARGYDLGSLRFVASVGEPLNPEGVVWGQEAFGLPVHDNWWQTETGGIMIANYRSMDIKPGSMGRPLPGIDAVILRRDAEGELVIADGAPVIVDDPDEEGELALRAGWPSMFRGYLHEDARYERCFVGGWYRTGDLARRDADDYFWFVGRGDDVIKSAGHLIGPFEVESVLMEHPAVAEAGVIGVPDPVAGAIVKAFVVLAPSVEATEEEIRSELLGFARARLGAAVAPRAIDFRDELPRTRSGKIMRRLLRARELGLPEGDLSTLESGG